MSNPWKTLATKQVYDNPWITVREDKIINPRGGDGIYGVVSFKYRAIGIIPIDEEGFTYLVGQHRYSLDEYSWEIPMGGGPKNELPIEAAKRELKEETGFMAESWEEIAKIHTSNSVTDEEGYIFVAENLIAGETEFDDTEDLKLWKLPLREAIDLVMNNTITDSLTVYGLLKIARLRNI